MIDVITRNNCQYAFDSPLNGRFFLKKILGFFNASNRQKADQIVSIIFNFFKRQNSKLQQINIIAQSYDGGSVMSGHLKWQAKIKEYYPNPSAVYIHCMAHHLNLIVVDICSSIKVYYQTSIFLLQNNLQNQ